MTSVFALRYAWERRRQTVFLLETYLRDLAAPDGGGLLSFDAPFFNN
jgi:hypothetical protein